MEKSLTLMFGLAMILCSVHAALQLPGYINPEEHKWKEKTAAHFIHSPLLLLLYASMRVFVWISITCTALFFLYATL